MKKGYYKCECGKEFDNPQSFNGHKSHCETHLKALNKEVLKEKIEKNLKKGTLIRSQDHKNQKIKALDQWLLEKHICEHCGKVMTEKFGSGRFCSRACANSRKQTEEANQKRREKATSKKSSSSLKHKQALETYYKDPKKCPICGRSLSYESRHRIYCSDECENVFRSYKARENSLGGLTKGHGTGKAGKYKGIRCDSKYELAYVVYCLENGLKITRNKKAFVYQSFDNKEHKFYPDFYLPETQEYIEIKGYYQENTSYKVKAMLKQKVNFKILYWNDLKKCLQFIKEKFNIAYYSLDKLYDKI